MLALNDDIATPEAAVEIDALLKTWFADMWPRPSEWELQVDAPVIVEDAGPREESSVAVDEVEDDEDGPVFETVGDIRD